MRETIKKRIISFNIFIKYQSNFTDGKERICIMCLPYSTGSLREELREK